MSFIETPRFPEEISQGSSGGPVYSTDIVMVKSGFEARNANWTESRHSYDASYGVRTETQLAELIEYFHATQGMANTFRFKDWGDYKSVNIDQTISATDSTIGTGDGSTVAFQLVKNYTKGLTTQRDIKKPVDSTTIISIDDASQTSRFSTDTTTGIVTFDSDVQKTCTGGTSANPCVLTFTSHTLLVGDSIYLSTFTGDWAALNGTRYIITARTASTITIAVDAAGYTAYSANGGQLNTIPQSSEIIKAGFEFDVPCRFDTDRLTRTFDDYQSGSINVPIVEVKL